jgi:malonate decarboxylase epsilon subunit
MISYLYPGQGAQRAGMLTSLPMEPPVEATLTAVSHVIGHDVRDLDSAELTTDTVSAQLVLFTIGVACTRLLAAKGIRPDAVAGHSIGAFAAAVTAEVLSLEEAAAAVRIRAEGMRDLFPARFGLLGMLGIRLAIAERLVSAVRGAEDLFVAMENAEDQIVLAGSDEAFDRVRAAAPRFGVRELRRLKVAVPSHCALMTPVATAVADYLQTIRPRHPTVRYLCGITARRAFTADAVCEDLSAGVAQMVRWRDTTDLLAELGTTAVVQISPGHTTATLFAAAHRGVPVIALDDTPFNESLKRILTTTSSPRP